ncbi:Uma2 family endonuclease [Granulicella sp. dw_53]|uniref:Uma2 family endonuclease n=1 Tax=Granulicella sp. dw_53 TaxID=2719792 RepID=UPI001BD2AAB1|nr:Uma2 family endonuclease [Granulicella sp. dw_53]
MATSTLVPLSEYLKTSYRPDRDWIDGEVRERNMGEGSHAILQVFFVWYFRERLAEWKIRVRSEQRIQTSATHYRIPDICLSRASDPHEEIITIAPLLCVEILSPEDRLADIQDRLDDYFGMGIEAVWVIDPKKRRAFMAGLGGLLQPVTDELNVPGTPIKIRVAEVFAELDAQRGTTPDPAR